MKIKVTLFIIFIVGIIFIHKIPPFTFANKIEHPVEFKSTIPQVELYYSIIKYSKQYNVPEGYLFAIAKSETQYGGPLDKSYVPNLVSSANAVGPMQIKLSTAKMFCKTITYNQLKDSVDLNVKISAMALNHLYKYYGDWQKAFGAYNTGRPILNSYSYKVINKTFDWE